MRVFVTGVEGYIGAVLVPELIRAGHDVTGLDTGYYREGWLFSRNNAYPETPRTLFKDLREIEPADIEGFDAVVHLAELSNDPLGENNPDVTYDINHKGSVRLAELAKIAGVGRFVYTSSCSVYGVSDSEFVDEDSETNPQTAYARCKVLVENDVSSMTASDFAPTFLRNATAYGASPRMRFDIVLNNLMGVAWTTGNVEMTSDGSPWRPLVHVRDICTAIVRVLSAPEETVSGEILNVGSTNENLKIRDIAEEVAKGVPNSTVSFGPSGGDNRSYRVNFDKIQRLLPGFACEWTVQDGVRELRSVFEQVRMQQSTFEFRAFTRLKQLNYLIESNQLDAGFYWVRQ